jgi:hypothetical protein
MSRLIPKRIRMFLAGTYEILFNNQFDYLDVEIDSKLELKNEPCNMI